MYINVCYNNCIRNGCDVAVVRAHHSNITTVAYTYTATHTIYGFNQFYELCNEF